MAKLRTVRTIRNPESYMSAGEIAACLREAADNIEKSSRRIKFSLQFWFASPEEIEHSLRRKGTAG